MVRQRREELGLSREDIARRALLSSETLVRIERGLTAEPGVFTARALARSLEWNLDGLLDAVDQSPLVQTPRHLTARSGLLSIGYEGRTIDVLVEELASRQVSTLVDVRLTPISRKSGLSKQALSDALGRSGIAYLHAPTLGNPKDNRAGFADPDDSTHRIRYELLLRGEAAKETLAEVDRIASQGLTALLCYESDERHCHRKLVVEELKRQNPGLVVQRA